MYFIPENGEEVLVAFENDNAEKPCIQGTMYNGNETSGYNTAGNDKKVIQTRSGTKIIMNDAIGSVFIEDPSGNTWMMDGKGNIIVNAPNTFSINATDINITASKDINVSAGVNQTVNVGINQSTNIGMMHNMFVGGNSIMNVTGNLTEMIDGDIHSETKKDRNESSIEPMNIMSEGNINKHSKTAIQNNSGEKSKMF